MSDPIKTFRSSLESFFDAASLPQYRKYIRSILYAAGHLGYWQKGTPARLMDIQERILQLVEAVHVFSKTKSRPKTGAITGSLAIKHQIMEVFCCFRENPRPNAWDLFPRCLTRKELADPYSVFEKFFSYRSHAGWKEDLKEILRYALSSNSAVEMNAGLDFLGIYLQLSKLIEACHLVLVVLSGEN